MPTTGAPPRDVFLDTNVLLDHLLHRDEHDGRGGTAKAMLEACVRHDVILRCAPTSLKDIAYITETSLRRAFRSVVRPSAGGEPADSLVERELMRTLLRKIPWNCIERTLSLCEVAPIDRTTCDRAISLCERHDDFEDDLIIAAAQQAGSDHVVTSDKALIEHFPELCITPRRLMELLEGME